ncbi:MFS transporter [Spirochaeta africana]|uniref:Fucose permease n=1 Tax=Spirochaeta africana (strain ATCC 700263 / DSM 8902 / Z-7692) TaxID=889378 RepID=H9UHK7_SPIAZ|nr:MFS transporter [Spirochaeta africana]AFG37000.1 fucose permease [Spirochaeta africana DSM 8902]
MPHRKIQLKLIASHLLFALIVTSMPSLLAVFRLEFGLGVFQSSVLPMAITVPVMIANLFVGFLIAHIGQKAVLLSSLVLEITGLILVSLAPGFAMVLIGFSLVGLATGAAFTALTTVYSELPEKYQDFGLYHAFFGVAGILSPIIISFWLEAGLGYRSLFGVYAGLFVLLMAALSTSRSISNQKFREFAITDMVKVAGSPLMLLGVSVFALYAAVEIGGSTWSVSAGISIFSLSSRTANLLLSAFWLVFTLMRFGTDAAARRVGALNLVRGCLLLAVVSLIVWIVGLTPYAFVLLGAALGPVFPAFQKHMNGLLPRQQRGLFNGLSYLATGVASTVFIPLMGGIGEQSLAYAYIPLVVCGVAMVLVVTAIRRHTASS